MDMPDSDSSATFRSSEPDPHVGSYTVVEDFVVALGTAKTRSEMEKFTDSRPKTVKRVVILGGGQISPYLSRRLIQQGISVRIIEQDSRTAEELDEKIRERLAAGGSSRDIARELVGSGLRRREIYERVLALREWEGEEPSPAGDVEGAAD